MLESQNVQCTTLDTPVRWRAHQLMQTTTNWGTSRVKLNKPEVQSHDHLREVELNVKELNHRKYSSFHFLLFNMHLCPKTSSKPIYIWANVIFLCVIMSMQSRVDEHVSVFRAYQGKQKPEELVCGWVCRPQRWWSQVREWAWPGRWLDLEWEGVLKCPTTTKKSNITVNLLESRFNWKLWKSIFPDSETFWLMGWIMN